MKTLTNRYTLEYRKINKVLLTGSILTGVLTGWMLGSFTTQAFSQPETQKSNTENTVLFSIPVKGEILPTVMLNEFSVMAEQTIKK